jgi:hypothetical protein
MSASVERQEPILDDCSVVELRVHGVSGTPPEELLDRAAVRRFDEGGPTGFYRPADPEQLLDHNGDQQPDAYLEGYAWGGLTSGAISRALWLLLLPFALVNAAPRLRPAGAPGSARAVWALFTLFRLLALSLTATLIVAVAGIGVDLLAWQCGGEAGRCAVLPSEAALTTWTPGHRLLLGLALPFLVLGAIYILSRSTAVRYEQATADGERTTPGSPDDVDPHVSHAWLWRGDYMVRRQRSVHLQVGLLAVTVLLCGSLSDADYGRIALAVTLATIVLGALLLMFPTVVGRRRHPPLWWLPRPLWVATVVSIALVAWPLATDPAAVRPDGGGALHSYDAVITGLFAVQLALVILIGVVTVLLRGQTQPSERSRQPMHGFAAPLVAALACLLGALYSAGAYISAANWLTSGVVVPDLTGSPHGGALLLPPSLRITAVAALAAAGITAVAVAVTAHTVLGGWRRSEMLTELLTTYTDRDPPNQPVPDRDDEIKKIFWRAALVDRAPSVLTPLLTVLTLGAIAVTALVVAARFSTTAAALAAAIAGATLAATLGAYVIVGLAALTSFAAFLGLRSARTRRQVGILWDLLAFWPRAVHPLAPPCYAERTVPELVTRIRVHTGAIPGKPDPDGFPVGALVLAAHSQGSVIATATLLQIAGDDSERRVLPRVALLTYGCVLRRLYSRYFPAYFGVPTLEALAREIATTEPDTNRWCNLWRLSDQLGGPVAFDPDTLAAIREQRASDRLLVDPEYRATPGSRPYGHSGYTHDPTFQKQVGLLARASRRAIDGLPTGR